VPPSGFWWRDGHTIVDGAMAAPEPSFGRGEIVAFPRLIEELLALIADDGEALRQVVRALIGETAASCGAAQAPIRASDGCGAGHEPTLIAAFTCGSTLRGQICCRMPQSNCRWRRR